MKHLRNKAPVVTTLAFVIRLAPANSPQTDLGTCMVVPSNSTLFQPLSERLKPKESKNGFGKLHADSKMLVMRIPSSDIYDGRTCLRRKLRCR